MNTRFLLVAVALLVAPVAANAADLPAMSQPVAAAAPAASVGYDWTGFYAGVNAGYGTANSYHWTTGDSTPVFGQNGGLLGATVGYNWQQANIVYGLEADWGISRINGENDTYCTPTPCTTHLKSFGTLRPRLGVAVDNWMPYVTGGLAWGLIEGSDGVSSGSKWRPGWTAGAGVEFRPAEKWSMKAEYLYGKLSTVSLASTNHVVEKDINIFRVGVNYHF